jgi:hypothetical protein
MTQLQEKAIARSADHENLVGELVEALKRLLKSNARMKPPGSPKSDAEKQAEAALAKAEAQQ